MYYRDLIVEVFYKLKNSVRIAEQGDWTKRQHLELAKAMIKPKFIKEKRIRREVMTHMFENAYGHNVNWFVHLAHDSSISEIETLGKFVIDDIVQETRDVNQRKGYKKLRGNVFVFTGKHVHEGNIEFPNKMYRSSELKTNEQLPVNAGTKLLHDYQFENQASVADDTYDEWYLEQMFETAPAEKTGTRIDEFLDEEFVNHTPDNIEYYGESWGKNIMAHDLNHVEKLPNENFDFDIAAHHIEYGKNYETTSFNYNIIAKKKESEAAENKRRNHAKKFDMPFRTAKEELKYAKKQVLVDIINRKERGYIDE
jgi:hypothetical protein